MKHPWLKRALSWALYDWANSAFAPTVMSAFVPILNKDFWSAGAADTVSTFRLSVASSTAAIIPLFVFGGLLPARVKPAQPAPCTPRRRRPTPTKTHHAETSSPAASPALSL